MARKSKIRKNEFILIADAVVSFIDLTFQRIFCSTLIKNHKHSFVYCVTISLSLKEI